MTGNKYACTFRMGIQEAMEYRFDFVMTLISMVFPVITSVCLWTAVNEGSGNIADTGYTYPQLLLYTILAALMSKLITGGFEAEINEDIKMGGLNKYLVKPVSYMKYRYCALMGNRLPGTSAVIHTDGRMYGLFLCGVWVGDRWDIYYPVFFFLCFLQSPCASSCFSAWRCGVSGLPMHPECSGLSMW